MSIVTCKQCGNRFDLQSLTHCPRCGWVYYQISISIADAIMVVVLLGLAMAGERLLAAVTMALYGAMR